jgi:hypothetical protein
MRHFGGLGLEPLVLRRARVSRAGFVLAVLSLAGGALIGATGAAGETVTTMTPFGFPGTNACVIPAEDFVATGNLRLAISGNASGGGTATSRIGTTLQGLQAVVVTALGATKKYVVPGESTQSFMFDTDGAPFHFTMESMVQFIRQGDDGTYITGDDFYEHVLIRVRVNANGTANVEDVSGDSRCQ